MSDIYKVNNQEEAIKLAKEFSEIGKYNFFRGQSQNWEVTPSSARLNKNDFEEGIEKLKRLYSFFETSENLLNHSALKVQRFVLRGTESPSFISFENEI
jgi:hypothetical protein